MLFSRSIKLFLLVLCAFLLSQCAKVTDSPAPPPRASQQLTSPYTMPATAYLALAKNQMGNEKQSLLIMAAGRLIYDGMWREGLKILSQTSDLSPELTSEKHLLLCKIDLIRGQPRLAITKLSSVHDINRMPIYYQVQFHEMLAHAYQAVESTTESVRERIKLEKLLPDEASKANNRRALWLSLTMLPVAELNTLAIEAPDGSELKGWVQLALISRKPEMNAQMMLAEVRQWQSQYPEHSGQYILPSPLDNVAQHLFSPPRKIALLLPLTGPLSGPGGAIKDGFMAGYNASNVTDSVNIHVYNTDATNVAMLYQQAVSDGADFIVGPLSKSNVAIVAAMNHPVPTLLLNDVDTKPKEGAYQFGLSLSNEARQVAAKIRKNGYSRALIISPTGAWGDDITTAFTSQWRANGGMVVDTLHYTATDEMNKVVRDFLRVSDSEARGKQMKQLLGHSLESTPSRRRDFDVIFLLAYPSKARQIMPLLHYYYAGDVPVYGTSTLYAGSANAMKDKDLDGIVFCDMPWVFAHSMGNKSWPEQFNSYNRLYALGIDGYALTTQLNQLLLFPAMGVSDKSGVLYLTPSNQIARISAWGQFKQGLAQQISYEKSI